MPELNTYLLLSLVSAAVIFVSGIHLLLKSIPRTEKMESYRVSCRFLFGAYFILALASDRSNFHNQFKGITGMSPEDYRKFHLINHKEYARDTRMD